MILPIIMLCVCAVSGAGVFIFIRQKDKKKKKEIVSATQKTANEFTNVKDIRGKYLYTQDGYIICLIRLNPISIDLYSKIEKQAFIRLLTAELSAVQSPFKFLAVSRPIDISPLINELSGLVSNAENTQKELLKHELEVMNEYAKSGEIVERQFYISVCGKYEDGNEREILSRTRELLNIFENGGVSCEIIEDDEIIKLICLINNPAYIHKEDTDFRDEIPMLI